MLPDKYAGTFPNGSVRFLARKAEQKGWEASLLLLHGHQLRLKRGYCIYIVHHLEASLKGCSPGCARDSYRWRLTIGCLHRLRLCRLRLFLCLLLCLGTLGCRIFYTLLYVLGGFCRSDLLLSRLLVWSVCRWRRSQVLQRECVIYFNLLGASKKEFIMPLKLGLQTRQLQADVLLLAHQITKLLVDASDVSSC